MDERFVIELNGPGAKTPLEAIALICEEIGELSHEIRKKEPNGLNISYELADIVLRTLDLASELDLDLEKAILSKIEYNINNIDEIRKKRIVLFN
ncbi:MAG: hypothetical protein JAY66_02030 [Candidatus Thiodiazotropha taylori]|nr:hypothetical protein [Candidatus Thiodiazotropha taylori]